MQGQQASEFQRRIKAHAIGVTRWIMEVSPTLYVEPPRFAPMFRDFYEQQDDHMPTQSLRVCFALAEEMENYFTNQDQEQARRRDHMRAKWTMQNNEFNNIMSDMHDLFCNNNM